MRSSDKACLFSAIVVGSVAYGVGASGCHHGLHSQEVSRALVGQEFLLRSAEGTEVMSGATLTLGFSETEVYFVAGCNRHFGSYMVDGGRLVVLSIASTEMACGELEQTQDAWLSGFFLAKPKLNVEGPLLRLSEGEEGLVFVERSAAEAEGQAAKADAPKP